MQSSISKMEAEDEFLHTFFTHVSQLCFDKAKEHVEKEKEPKNVGSSWNIFLNFLQQLAVAEKSYMEIGFLQNKHKSFLRKDNSLRSIYETLKNDLKKIEENCKVSNVDRNKFLQNYCQNISQYITARIHLICLYDTIYLIGANKLLKFDDIIMQIEKLMEKNALSFTDITLIPAKAVFTLECEILRHLFKALHELQRLQFLPSLTLVHGAHTRLAAWEGKMQSRESWKIVMFKNNPLPALFQWLQRLKGTVLSKFSLYFHDTLAQQTTPTDMRQLCAKLHHDHYQKMVSFQRKYDAACVILLSTLQVNCDTADYDSFPIIVSYPPRSPPQLETIIKMISDTEHELTNTDKIIYKYSSQGQCTYILSTVEANIYIVILFENKKTEKDTYIGTFVSEMCTNLRCTKMFLNLKNAAK